MANIFHICIIIQNADKLPSVGNGITYVEFIQAISSGGYSLYIESKICGVEGVGNNVGGKTGVYMFRQDRLISGGDYINE